MVDQLATPRRMGTAALSIAALGVCAAIGAEAPGGKQDATGRAKERGI